jgi:hypothetical protein
MSMAFRKRNSKALEHASQRLAGIKSIDPALDLGNGLSVATYVLTIGEADAALEGYNTQLSQADGLQNAFFAKEKALRDVSERMLVGVAAKYGKDSDEYEMAGGTKKSLRKRSRRVVQAVS